MNVAHGTRLALCSLIAVAALGAGTASATVVTSADVTLIDGGPVLSNTGPDTVAAGGSIQPGDATQIGTNILLTGESITINPLSFIYQVLGGNQLDCPVAGYSCTGYDAGAQFTFTNLQFSTPGDFIQNATLKLTNAVYASGFGMSFTGTSVTIDVGDGALGLLSNNNGVQDFGTVEVDLTIGNETTPSVPEPGTLALMGFGAMLAGLARIRRQA